MQLQVLDPYNIHLAPNLPGYRILPSTDIISYSILICMSQELCAKNDTSSVLLQDCFRCAMFCYAVPISLDCA